METKYPHTKEVLLVLGVIGLVTASVLAPGLPKALSPFLKKQYKTWGHFNKRKLKAEIKRLKNTGVIEEINDSGEIVFKLTAKGKEKLMRYKLENMSIDNKKWDGKWRLVIYDIPKEKKNQAESFRRLIKKMKFLQLQKSVYLTPYPCQEEINFLKTLYSVDDYVTVLTVTGIENQLSYQHYFGI